MGVCGVEGSVCSHDHASPGLAACCCCAVLFSVAYDTRKSVAGSEARFFFLHAGVICYAVVIP